MRGRLMAIAALAGWALPAAADSGNSEVRTGSASAQIVRPLVLVHRPGQVLNFGRFAVGTSTGTVIVSPSGAGSVTGGVSVVAGSNTASDRMTVSGDPNRLVSITTGSGSVSNGSATMSFTTTPSVGAGYIPFTGSGFFTIGGTLTVLPGQAAGSYSGSYPVVVSYN